MPCVQYNHSFVALAYENDEKFSVSKTLIGYRDIVLPAGYIALQFHKTTEKY